MRFLDMAEVKRITTLKSTQLQERIKAGDLPIRKLGSKSVILETDLYAWMEALAIVNQPPAVISE